MLQVALIYEYFKVYAAADIILLSESERAPHSILTTFLVLACRQRQNYAVAGEVVSSVGTEKLRKFHLCFDGELKDIRLPIGSCTWPFPRLFLFIVVIREPRFCI